MSDEQTKEGVTEAATADELARVFLRGRDVDCTGCGYNRRDGAIAECPECGEVMEFREVDGVSVRGLRRGVWIGVLLVLTMAMADLVSLAFLVVNVFVLDAWSGFILRQVPWSFLVPNAQNLIMCPLLLVLSLKSLRRLRRHRASGDGLPKVVAVTLWLGLGNILLGRAAYLILFYAGM